MGLYVGLEKYSCDICSKMGSKPTHTVIYLEDNTRVDICGECKDKAEIYPKFKQGISEGKIKIIKR